MISEKDANLLIRAANNFVRSLFKMVLESSKQVVKVGIDPNAVRDLDLYLNCARLLEKYNSSNKLLHVMYDLLSACNDREFLQNFEALRDDDSTLSKKHLMAFIAEASLEFVRDSLVPPNSDSVGARITYHAAIPMTLCNEDVWQYFNQYKSSIIANFASVIAQNFDDKNSMSTVSQYQLVKKLSENFLQELEDRIDDHLVHFQPLLGTGLLDDVAVRREDVVGVVHQLSSGSEVSDASTDETVKSSEETDESNDSAKESSNDENTTSHSSNVNGTSYSLDSTVARDEIIQTIRNSQIEIKEMDLFLPEDSYDIDKIIEASAANKEYLAAMAELQKAGEDKLAVVQVGDHSRLVLGENEDGTTPSSILPYMLPEDMEPITGPFSIWSDPLSTISGAGVLILSGIFAHEINHHGC